MRYLLITFLLVSGSFTLHAQMDTNAVFSFCEVMPSYATGEAGIAKHLRTNMKYPQVALDLHIEGVVYVGFIVERNGSISGVNVQKGIRECPELDSEAVRLIRSMPPWKPGTMDKQTVRCSMTTPVRFVARTAYHPTDSIPPYRMDTIPVLYSGQGDTAIYRYAMQMPSYNERTNASSYVQQNIKYPKAAVEAQHYGTVYVQFIVEKNGTVSNVRVKKGIDNAPELNEEAVRIYSTMPKWKAGTVNGKPVRTLMVEPVKFEKQQ